MKAEIIRRVKNFLSGIISSEKGERFIPGHATGRIDETAPSDFGGFYRFAAQFVKGAAILDTGCGCGYGIEYLVRSGAASCTGIDISQKALRYARGKFKEAGLSYLSGSAEDLSLFEDGKFDVVISIEVIEHLRDPQKHVADIFRVMKKGSILVLSTPNKETSPPGAVPANRFHVGEFNYDELKELLGRYFETMVIFENLLVSPFEEGQKHRAERMAKGEMGQAWAPRVKTDGLDIDCRYLYSNTHSFVAVCRR
ncbi:MAG: class I SAM-dependent methyltransferase [Elusimicrobia bacterium]|nr:class I SAM-dependent methyltransferase [Elusimicrobiota bacterium]